MNKINIVAFGGLGGSFYSAGLKTILMKAKSIPGVDFSTFEAYTSWKRWGKALQYWKDGTALLGHSFGVTSMFGAVRGMGKLGPSIPLAISFDPSQWWGWQPSLWGSGGNRAPDRIERVINFYQRGLPIGNQKIYRDDGSERGISNILISNVAHANIEDLPELQAKVVAELKLLTK